MLHCWDCIRQVMSSAWYSSQILLKIRPNSFILVLSDQRILFLTNLESFRCFFFSKLCAGFHVSCTGERLPSGLCALKPQLVMGCNDGSTTFSHFSTASLEPSHSDLWVVFYLYLSLARWLALGGALVISKFFHLKITEATLLLVTLSAAEMFCNLGQICPFATILSLRI